MKRIRNIVALAIIASVIALAHFYYSSPAVEIKGVTATEKLRSIAKIVSEKHEGYVSVTHIQFGPNAPGFIVAFTVSEVDITTQEKAMAVQSALRDSIAQSLRLTALEVLPAEPSIMYVGIMLIGLDGQSESYVASAQDLKTLAPNASERAWLGRLEPVGENTASPPGTEAPQNQSQ